MKFLENVKLNKAGYLVSESDNPVFNGRFVSAQREAHKKVTFANNLNKANFIEIKADTYANVALETAEQLSEESKREYRVVVDPIETPTIDALASEALSWISNSEQINNAGKVNQLMQQFNALAEFEEFGLYFEKGIAKLPKLYTIAEIQEAIETIVKYS